jgi:KUP system potassium uptake protein
MSRRSTARPVAPGPRRERRGYDATVPTALPAPEDAAAVSAGRSGQAAARAGTAALALGALGVVFGDIGTSPLYSLQAVFAAHNGAVRTTPADVYGVISLVFWAITMIVSVKYVTFIMRADNQGEGGIMALTTLLDGAKIKNLGLKAALITLGVLGASLFYGDGVITPAISVLSAVEGLKVATPSIGSLVLPITVAVLTILFAIQRYGTGVVGNLFGPVMATWFVVIGLIGAVEVAHHPDVLRALSPSYGAQFFINDGGTAFLALAGVVLAVTGAEALYADMGHFGRRPITRAWFMLAFPALTLNYLAQGSLIVRDPQAARNPFFLLLPGWAQVPMVLLATAATVIASQAVISGAFSVTQQAINLGFLPRMTIRHTSRRHLGQIYVPAVNRALFVMVVVLVIAFGSAEALAFAYGVAVTGTFILNTILFLAVARLLWHKPKRLIALGAVVFLTGEIAFFAANLTKLVHGGWLPIAVATAVFTVFMTWHKGRAIVTANRTKAEGSLRDFVEHVGVRDLQIRRVPGIGVFLNSNRNTTPLALRANVEHNRVIHDHVIILSVQVERVPHVPDNERVTIDKTIMFSGATGDPLSNPIDRITGLTVHYGFVEEPDIPSALRLAADGQLAADRDDITTASFFLSQITIVPGDAPGMSAWRKKLFLTMAHNAASPAEYFGLPDGQTVIMGGRIQL